MGGSDEKLCFSEKEWANVWKNYMERIMNEKNDRGCIVEGDAEGPVVCISRAEVLQALNEMKTGKASGPSEVWLELIVASGGSKYSSHDLNMSEGPRWILNAHWTGSTNSGSNLQGEGDIRNCSCYWAVKFLEHGMKVVERVLERRLRGIVSVDEMQFGSMPEGVLIDAVFILGRMLEDYHVAVERL